MKEHGNIDSSLKYFLSFDFPFDYKILDIGCRYGSLIYRLYKLGYKNVWGIDINKHSINMGKIKYKEIKKRLLLYDGEKIPFQNKYFDAVLMFDVIEHIPNIKIFLKDQVYRVLNEKRMLIFQTPNKIINIPWEIINQKSLTKWKGFHPSLQTIISLKKILKESGFQSVKIIKWNIITNHNKNKIKRKIPLGNYLLYIFQIFPLIIFPNFYGYAIKK